MKKKRVIPVICTVLATLFLFAGCLPFAKKESESTTVSENGSIITTDENKSPLTADDITTETPGEQENPPQVITYYTLKNVKKIDQYFTAGFDVKLPKIDSAKPGAAEINAEINKLKVNVEKASNAAGDLIDYREITECSYETAMKDNVVFISIKASHGLMESEFSIDNIYYAYDYVADKKVSNTDIALLFNLSETQVVSMVNTALQKDDTEVTGFDKIDLFVNTAGKLVADAKVESIMGGDYSKLIELT